MMRFGGMLNQETIKPRNLSETLGRLGSYFGRFWYVIVVAVLFIVVATWTQVTTPELTGQATDCFLVPAGASAFGNFTSFASQPGSPPQQTPSTCYLATKAPSTVTLSRQIIYKAYTLGGFTFADPLTATNAQRIAGLFRLILVMLGLFVLG